MNRVTGSEHRATADRPLRLRDDVHRTNVGRWFNRLVDRVRPTRYVDGCDIPDEPESPYRARLTLPIEHTPEGVEIRERDVVRGKMRIIYEVRCACGKRWFNPRLEAVQLCSRCGHAVLLQTPDGSVPPQSDS